MEMFNLVLVLFVTFISSAYTQNVVCYKRTPGWTPPSLEQRTNLSTIVLAGQILQTLPELEQEDGTYPADVIISDVFKGSDYLRNVSSVSLPPPHQSIANVYTIGGFGSRRDCLSPVTPHKKYILFLKTEPLTLGGSEIESNVIDREFRGDSNSQKNLRLMLEYGKGVAEPVDVYTDSKEATVLTELGWKSWSAWSSCGVCGPGHMQNRRRMCLKDVVDACEGTAKETRECNNFKCRDYKNLLETLQIGDFPEGVGRSRNSAYRISSNAVLEVGNSLIYGTNVFPAEFSVLLTFRLRKATVRGANYILMMVDARGNLRLGISLEEYPIVVYSHEGQIHSVEFPQKQLSNTWEFIAFAFQPNAVTMIADCSDVYTKTLPAGHQISVDVNGKTSIGAPRGGVNSMSDIVFVGDVEQVSILDGLEGAQQQCNSPEPPFPVPPESLFDAFPVPLPTTPTVPPTTTGITTTALTTDPAEEETQSRKGNTLDSPITIPEDLDPNIINPILKPSNLLIPTQSPGEHTTTHAAHQTPTTLPATTMTTSTTRTATTEKRATTAPSTTPGDEDNLIPPIVPGPAPSDQDDENNMLYAAKIVHVTTEEMPHKVPTVRQSDLRRIEPDTSMADNEVTHEEPQEGELSGRAPPPFFTYYNEKSPGVEWSAWSSCSTTCGTGSRYRFGFCQPGSTVRDCQRGKVVASQTRSCTLSKCAGSILWSDWSTCSRTCGSEAVKTRLAFCPDRHAHPDCQRPGQSIIERENCGLPECEDLCSPPCENGGQCQPGGFCVCPPGYTGHHCQQQTCSPKCNNGGQCLGNNFCLCPAGTIQPYCSHPCHPECANGGTCKKGKKCICAEGYTGRRCETAVCERPCRNGGTCVEPNICQCPEGYGGADCTRPICELGCNNGGYCIRPSICRCLPGYRGSRCDIPFCQYSCRNGGRCTGPNQCTCPAGFHGRLCHKTKCPQGCPYGSVCIGKNRCSEVLSSSKRRGKTKGLSRGHCRLQSFKDTHQVSYVKPVIRNIQLRCGPGGSRVCNSQRLEYTIAYKTKYRTSYRCAPQG